MYIHIHVYLLTCIYIYTYTCIYIYMYIFSHVYTFCILYIYIHFVASSRLKSISRQLLCQASPAGSSCAPLWCQAPHQATMEVNEDIMQIAPSIAPKQ